MKYENIPETVKLIVLFQFAGDGVFSHARKLPVVSLSSILEPRIITEINTVLVASVARFIFHMVQI